MHTVIIKAAGRRPWRRSEGADLELRDEALLALRQQRRELVLLRAAQHLLRVPLPRPGVIDQRLAWGPVLPSLPAGSDILFESGTIESWPGGVKVKSDDERTIDLNYHVSEQASVDKFQHRAHHSSGIARVKFAAVARPVGCSVSPAAAEKCCKVRACSSKHAAVSANNLAFCIKSHIAERRVQQHVAP